MIAVIPARSGSKGLPGKNTKNFNGKPLISWTFEAALKAKYINRILLSTDSPEIAHLASEYAIEVPGLRPPHLASDNSLANDTYKYLLNLLEKNSKNVLDELVILQPTSPLRLSMDIDSAIELYRDRNADSVVSYVASERPLDWYRYLDADSKIIMKNHEVFSNRQSKERTYYPNGAIYIIKSKLIHADTWYSENSYAYLMPRNRSVDIDNQDDFDYAEYLHLKSFNACMDL